MSLRPVVQVSVVWSLFRLYDHPAAWPVHSIWRCFGSKETARYSLADPTVSLYVRSMPAFRTPRGEIWITNTSPGSCDSIVYRRFTFFDTSLIDYRPKHPASLHHLSFWWNMPVIAWQWFQSTTLECSLLFKRLKQNSPSAIATNCWAVILGLSPNRENLHAGLCWHPL